MLGGAMSHTGPAGGHGTGAGTAQFVKESTVGQVRIAVDYPAATGAESETYVVTVSDAATMRPLSDARIRAHVRPSAVSVTPTDHSGTNEGRDTRAYAPEVRALERPGAYAFSFRADRAGTYDIGATLEAIGDTPLEAPVTVVAVRELTVPQHQSLTRSPVRPALILIGAAMTVMMILVMRGTY